MSQHPIRYCTGGPINPHYCGRVAVVVCSLVEECGGPPLQWFACSLPEHQARDQGADTEAIATWFARLERPQ